MLHGRLHKGFTLIEVMVVVVIIAIISGFSILAINQALDRRYSSQADDLHAWLLQVSELAMLEGSAYGIHITEEGLEPLVYYQYRWQRSRYPQAFSFNTPVSLGLRDEQGVELASREESAEALLPALVMLPDGYLEPRAVLWLRFDEPDTAFSYTWDDEQTRLVLQRSPL